MNLNTRLQYLILHVPQTKCGYACSDQLRSALALAFNTLTTKCF